MLPNDIPYRFNTVPFNFVCSVHSGEYIHTEWNCHFFGRRKRNRTIHGTKPNSYCRGNQQTKRPENTVSQTKLHNLLTHTVPVRSWELGLTLSSLLLFLHLSLFFFSSICLTSSFLLSVSLLFRHLPYLSLFFLFSVRLSSSFPLYIYPKRLYLGSAIFTEPQNVFLPFRMID